MSWRINKDRLLILILFLFCLGLNAQNETNQTATRVITVQDSLNMHLLPDFVVVADNNAYLKKYNRTKYFVRRVYAYSRLASDMLLSFQDTLESFDSKRKKRVYLNHANKLLKEEFGDEIKNMSITRGEYLMKLIYRDTEMTTYEIIQIYRGSGKAMWFQAICKLNGQDLKRSYDPEGEDMMIEKVVREIEEGKLAFIKRPPKTETGRGDREVVGGCGNRKICDKDFPKQSGRAYQLARSYSTERPRINSPK